MGSELAGALRVEGFRVRVTELAARGRKGPMSVVQTVVRRRETGAVVARGDRRAPAAFVPVEEPRAVRRDQLFPRRRK